MNAEGKHLNPPPPSLEDWYYLQIVSRAGDVPAAALLEHVGQLTGGGQLPQSRTSTRNKLTAYEDSWNRSISCDCGDYIHEHGPVLLLVHLQGAVLGPQLVLATSQYEQ